MVEQQDTQAIMEGKGRVKEVRCGRRQGNADRLQDDE